MKTEYRMMGQSMRQIIDELDEETKPIKELFNHAAKIKGDMTEAGKDEFLKVAVGYFPADKVNHLLEAEPAWDVVNLETVFDDEKIRLDFGPGAREMYKTNFSLDMLDDEVLDLVGNDGIVYVEFILGEFDTVGFFLTTAKGLHGIKDRFPDIYRGLTQLEDGNLDANAQNIPERAVWTVEYGDSLVHYETENFVWWHFEHEMNYGMVLKEHENGALIHSCQEEESWLYIQKHLLEKVFDNTIFTRGFWNF